MRWPTGHSSTPALVEASVSAYWSLLGPTSDKMGAPKRVHEEPERLLLSLVRGLAQRRAKPPTLSLHYCSKT